MTTPQTLSADIEITTDRTYRTYSDGTTCRRFMLQPDGVVLAWDHISHHYTRLHSLSAWAQGMIRGEAIRAQVSR